MARVFVFLRTVMILAFTAFITSSCENDYFQRPDWLQKPIYAYLEERGNFTHFLACIDKTGFERSLKHSGFYTVFAPTDSAFAIFMQQHGINSIDEISSQMAHAIVSYAMVPVGSLKSEIDDHQIQVRPEEAGRNHDIAFKRATFNYKGVYQHTDHLGITRYVFDANAVQGVGGGSGINIADFNKKSIPFFTTPFLNRNNLTAFDYNFFFPQSEFSGFNVAGARVIESDIVTENGVIHVVDKVTLPLPNLDELLRQTSEVSDFLSLLDRFMVEYIPAPTELEIRQEQATGIFRDIYVKTFGNAHFAPNSENFLRFSGGDRNDAQINGWTLFAPTNEALEQYFTNVFLARGYTSLEQMPAFVINEFINAHFFRSTVWPSNFSSVQNFFGEPARFDVATNVVNRAMGSNGLFYVVNRVQETNSFSTVLGEILLNPAYTTMYQALVATENNFILRNPILDLDVFLISNQHFNSIGLNFNMGLNQWEHTNPDWGVMPAFIILDRLVNMHILFDQDLNLAPGAFGLIETNAGEYIRYLATAAGTRVWGPGQTLATASRLLANPSGGLVKESTNGGTMLLDRPLMFSTRNIGHFLEGNAAFRPFLNYLLKSASSPVEGGEGELSRLVYSPETQQIAGIGSAVNQTYLIPNATAIANAVRDGLLPPITAAPFTNVEQEQVLRFMRYHILNDEFIRSNATYNYKPAFTHYRDDAGSTVVYVTTGTGNTLEFTDRRGRTAVATATATSGTVNVIGNRAVIHLINNYLDYRPLP